MNIAFFDFDGTISRRDSMFDFIYFSCSRTSFFFKIVYLLPLLIFTKVKLFPNNKAKEILLSSFFRGYSYERFVKLTNLYSLRELHKIIRLNALKRIKWHQKRGDKVVVVSASIDLWLLPWCEKHNVDLLATKLEVINNLITGNLLNKNCYGLEKVRQIKSNYKLSLYKKIYAYGDSVGDKEMLELADEKYFKFF